MRYMHCIAAFVVASLIFFAGCQSADMTSAKVYIQQKELDQALVHLKKEMEKNPANAEAFFLAGQIYGEMDSLEQMMKAFARTEELDAKYADSIAKWRKSKSAETFNKGIKLYESKKDIDGAIKWTLVSTNIQPENINAWKNLAFLYQEKMGALSAMPDSMESYNVRRTEIYERLIQIEPNDAEVLWILAGLYTQNGQPEKAVKLLEPHLAENTEPRVFFAAADAYDALDDTTKALEMLKKAETLAPDNTDLLFDIGVRYYGMKDFGTAAEYFDKVLAKKPENTDALYNKSLSLFYAEKYADAEKATIELLKRDARNTEYWDQLAVVWAKTGKGKDATNAAKVSAALRDGKIEDAKMMLEKLGIDVKINE